MSFIFFLRIHTFSTQINDYILFVLIWTFKKPYYEALVIGILTYTINQQALNYFLKKGKKDKVETSL
jgi:hypothetical protein